ncbi:Ribonucleoprotein PTB-binding 2 [Liparis tanakae]|uniref:Ribonucleoprotein PTB-binding 2 n=1 Tax=Liparis tanakae TaxID=230148 RepID=A0A4Z2F8Q2_9TELE|nr:Ribonucleoprotein PTB-binding 2 [Liparis tanakae]
MCCLSLCVCVRLSFILLSVCDFACFSAHIFTPYIYIYIIYFSSHTHSACQLFSCTFFIFFGISILHLHKRPSPPNACSECTSVCSYTRPSVSSFASFVFVARLHAVPPPPPPAFVTLLNGDQAQDAIRSLHHSTVRGRPINVALQPTDSLLCLTNLPHTFAAPQLEEMVRAYGNIERSFLVYSELTGHSKGYGFVEYMKKDSASRARSELLGRVLDDRSLMVQWMDVNQLSHEEKLHSRCLCISRLPLDLCDSEELTRLFSETYKPVFCQLAQDESSPVRGFGVVEYESSEQAEAVLMEMDRTPVGGQEVRLSLCTPGTSGRSTLAALIAAQGMVSTRGASVLSQEKNVFFPVLKFQKLSGFFLCRNM